ncbi:Cysteine dioxygenase, partial [Nowakowskiella sp. JEL0078]
MNTIPISDKTLNQTSLKNPRLQEQTTLPQIQTLTQLTQILRDELEYGGLESEHIDVSRIQAIMESYTSKPSEWIQYAQYDSTKPYTRNLVDDGNGHFNLMVLCWGADQQRFGQIIKIRFGSPIHDHSGSHCLMKVLSGSICETQYSWPILKAGSLSTEKLFDSMVVKKKSSKFFYLRTDKIGLHRISANGSVVDETTKIAAVSLHLYCPPYDRCKTFCEMTGVARGSGKCLFFTKGGQKCLDSTTEYISEYVA